MTKGKYDIVVACDLARGIGIQNKLPWRLSADMKYFRELTQGDRADGKENFVIMGRNTWLSIPPKHRPLPYRRNIVLTKNATALQPPEAFEGVGYDQIEVCSSFDDAVAFAASNSTSRRCFVIGGAKVYEQAVDDLACEHLYLTQIKATFECDVFFPPYEEKFFLLSETEEQEENGVHFSFKVYKRGAKPQ